MYLFIKMLCIIYLLLFLLFKYLCNKKKYIYIYISFMLSGFWTVCFMFFPCPSWVCLFGYFPVLVKLIDLFLVPVLVLLDYFLCVYKSWVLPKSLSVHSSSKLCILCSFIKRIFILTSRLLRPSHYTTVTYAFDRCIYPNQLTKYSINVL